MNKLFNEVKDCTWFKVAIGGVVVYTSVAIIRKYKAASRKAKLRELWDSRGKDVVTVHMFNRAFNGPNPSPYPVKLETYLRIAGIKYVPDFEEPMSSKGKSPWITFDGKDVADSQLAIEHLTTILCKDIERNFTETEKAISRSLRILVEEHFYWCIVLERWYYHGAEDTLHYFAGLFPAWMPDWLLRRTLRKFGKRVLPVTQSHGIGRHTQEEVEAFGKADMTALSEYLGNKKFLLGDQPCLADTALFGMIAYVVLVPENSRSVYKKHLETNCTNLLRHHKTIIDMYWPDYNECKFKKEK